MINRQNWKDVRGFLQFQEEVKRLSPKSITRNRGALRRLLEWADDRLLPGAQDIRPTFPAYVDNIESRRGGPLARKTKIKYCSLARQFFEWAARQWPKRYGPIGPNWVESLRPNVTQDAPEQKEHYTLEEVHKLLDVEGRLMSQRRAKAAAALLFLSGMRVGALVTLPIRALDLEAGKVKQWPSLGVETKGGKAATTHLLSDLPKLWAEVRAWDEFVRGNLPDTLYWFARLDRQGRLDTRALESSSRARRQIAARGLKGLCDEAGIKYKSPHKMRHGHAIYASAQAETMAEYKAVSQNLMHASLATTDKVYHVLNEAEVQNTIAELSRRAAGDPSPGPIEGEADPKVIARAVAMALKMLQNEG